MRYINELREGDNVSEVYLCKVKNIAKTKAGKTYYSMILQDKTGVIDTKIWDIFLCESCTEHLFKTAISCFLWR